MKKKITLIGGVITIYLILMGIGFYGGFVYQQKNGTGLTNGAPAMLGTPAGGGVAANQAGIAPGGRTMGQVKSIDGNTLTISTAQDVTTVIVSDATTITKPAAGTSADIKVGDMIQVTGQTLANGDISASQVVVSSPRSEAVSP